MVKLLAIGDLHIKKDNVIEINLFMERILRMIPSLKLDAIVVLGDVLHDHEKLLTPCLNHALTVFEQFSDLVKTYVLVGNHDMESNQVYLEGKHWMNPVKKWKNIIVVDKPIIECIKEMNFLLTPYVYPGRFIECLETVKPGEKIDDWIGSLRCIFAHQEFYGTRMGAITSEEGDKWSKDYPLIVSGHIHQKDWLQKNIYYTGTPLQHAFGESESNTVCVFEFTEDNFTFKEIDLELPRKKIIYRDIDNLDHIVFNQEDKVKLVVSGNYEEFKAFTKTQRYKELRGKIRIVYNAPKIKTDGKQQEHKTISFLEILYDKILHDENLVRIYKRVV